MEIKAFKALRFDSAVVGDTGTCVAPPYDVIDEELQEKLHQRSRYNIVRIIRGKESAADNDNDNKYTRARGFFDELIETGALKPDDKEAIYGYVQDFDIAGKAFQRSGFVALGKLEEFGKGVCAHEKILEGPLADRLNLMRATEAQFGQIFMIYDDPGKTSENVIAGVCDNPPLMDFVDDNGVRHRIFAIDDPSDIAKISAMMADKQPIIADGHHRYTTALQYSKESGNPAAKYRMMAFVNMQNEGMLILPTHRLAGGFDKFDVEDLIGKIKEYFEVKRYTFDSDDQKAKAEADMFEQMDIWHEENANALGLYAADGGFYAFVLRDTAAMDEFADQLSQASRLLDVNVLHRLVLEKMLGVGDKQLASQSNLKYIKGIGDAVEKSISRVDSGQSQAVFFMNATRMEHITAVAATGERMPQKSTFFYPKVYTGLVINKL